jgi:hypothetical protein
VKFSFKICRHFFGHNLSGTGATMRKGQCSVGIQLLGCALSDRLMIGTSPWLLKDYQMASAFVRFRVIEKEGFGFAYQAAYYRTQKRQIEPLTLSPYDMEAMWNQWIFSVQSSESVWVHLNQSTNYYFRERSPFSLRRPSNSTSPWQFNSSLLIESRLNDGFFIAGEIGLLDVGRAPQHFHLGASLGRKTPTWQWHGGFSISAAGEALDSFRRTDYGMMLGQTWEGHDSIKDEELLRQDFSLHPEFAIQFFF